MLSPSTVTTTNANYGVPHVPLILGGRGSCTTAGRSRLVERCRAESDPASMPDETGHLECCRPLLKHGVSQPQLRSRPLPASGWLSIKSACTYRGCTADVLVYTVPRQRGSLMGCLLSQVIYRFISGLLVGKRVRRCETATALDRSCNPRNRPHMRAPTVARVFCAIMCDMSLSTWQLSTGSSCLSTQCAACMRAAGPMMQPGSLQ